MDVLVTGSAGLIGSESSRFYAERGNNIIGIDNDMRKYFFGHEASTKWSQYLLEKNFPDNYVHYDIDIRDEEKVEELFKTFKFELIIHTAAQPSHDWAAKEPLTDFTINANGTIILLENCRKYCPEAVFIFTSTNKVYGDTPNYLPLAEFGKRYELDSSHKFYERGIDETMSIDSSMHSLFGASKVAADVTAQEYGRYFNLRTGIFRGGCLTGPAHSGAELHGFLAYLAKCIITGRKYTIFGYKGKQVRDNIHSYDLINAFDHFFRNPGCGKVYNIGGSRHSNISILEAIDKIEEIIGQQANIKYSDINRAGDHIWYISDVSKFMRDYPGWKFSHDIDDILVEICKEVEGRYRD